MDNYCVYVHTCPNGKVYVGITCKNVSVRWRNGNGYKSNEHFFNAIVKYGWDNIRHEILFDGLPKEEACQKEIELISEYRSNDRRYGYNNSFGGEHGRHSEQSRQKIKEHHADISGQKNFWYGKSFSDEHRERLRKAHIGNTSRARTVLRFDKDWNYIDSFNGSVQAGRAVGAAPANIRKVCDGQRKFAGGFRWKWNENK